MMMSERRGWLALSASHAFKGRRNGFLRAPLFWAVGPGGVNRAFRVGYEGEMVRLEGAGIKALAYPGPTGPDNPSIRSFPREGEPEPKLWAPALRLRLRPG